MKQFLEIESQWDFEDNYWDIRIHSSLHLDIGNNYTISHFIDSLKGSYDPLADKIIRELTVECSIDDLVAVTCQGNYGEVSINICASDLFYFL